MPLTQGYVGSKDLTLKAKRDPKTLKLNAAINCLPCSSTASFFLKGDLNEVMTLGQQEDKDPAQTHRGWTFIEARTVYL